MVENAVPEFAVLLSLTVSLRFHLLSFGSFVVDSDVQVSQRPIDSVWQKIAGTKAAPFILTSWSFLYSAGTKTSANVDWRHSSVEVGGPGTSRSTTPNLRVPTPGGEGNMPVALGPSRILGDDAAIDSLSTSDRSPTEPPFDAELQLASDLQGRSSRRPR